jgi:VanZ family protein
VNRFTRYALPLILWAAIIFFLSEQRALPIRIATGWDKVGHSAIYLVLGALSVRFYVGYGSSRWAAFGLALGTVAVYGASDELHQLLNPPRTADIRDWVADVAGGSVGALLYTLTASFRRS